MVPFIMLYKVVLTFVPIDDHESLGVAIQMKAIEQFFHAVLLIIYVCRARWFQLLSQLTSVDETFVFVLSCDTSCLLCCTKRFQGLERQVYE